jgi:hypothetical protein
MGLKRGNAVKLFVIYASPLFLYIYKEIIDITDKLEVTDK